jgi:hypothetical protein
MLTTAHALLLGSLSLPSDQPFTRAMALAGGVKDKRLGQLVSDGWLRRPVRGLYIPSQLPDTVALRASALALIVPPGCFASDFTAAWLHAGDIALPPNSHIATPLLSFFRPPREGRLRNKLTLSGERTVLPQDLMSVGPLLVTTPLRTALDLGRLQRNHDLALHGMDRMLALDAFTLEELVANIARFKRQRGVVQLRVLGPRADGRSASFGESSLRGRWYDAGLPRPELQLAVSVAGDAQYFLDMGLEEVLFAAEYDGEEWHSSDEDRAHDEARRVWMRERRAWQIEVYRKNNVFGFHQDAAQLLAAAFREARSTLGQRIIVL